MPFIAIDCFTRTLSNHPQRRGLPVEAPNSAPCWRSFSPIDPESSVGNGPPPTLVV